LIGTVGIRVGNDWYAEESRQTTPESLDVHRFLRRMVDAGVSHAVIEATSHGLSMHRLDDVHFSVAAVTNVTHEHLDYHGTIDAYRQAKGKLFALTGERAGTAVINLEDDGARAMRAYARACREVIDYGVERATASIGAQNVRLTATGSVFDLSVPGAMPVEVRLPLIGRFNVENALCAAAIAHAVGIDSATISQGLSDAPTVPGRMAGIDEGQPFAVIVDYAHTPDAIAKILTLLRDVNPAGRLIVVFGSAGERDIDKRARQGEITACLADYFVITSEDPRHEDPDAIIAAIAGGAVAAGAVEGDSFVRVTDRREAIRTALAAARPADGVLLAGKGHERSIIWGREKRPWDEAVIARELLREAGWSSLDGAES
jgi:UDP-N-acetylmuramoyl-L-alanyl-D-glutamate--2,6-diaminopimelate ligase